MFEAIKPGDAMLLMDETGDNAWGVRRVFLVRRTAEGSIVYFDREFDFVDQPITFVGDGDKRVLRRIDLDVVDTVLNCVHPPHDAGEDHDPQELCQGSFAWFCDMGVADTPANRVYVRKLLETIVTDDLLGPAQGPEEEVVGMSVRDRYILGRLGPRRVDDLSGPHRQTRRSKRRTNPPMRTRTATRITPNTTRRRRPVPISPRKSRKRT